MFNLFKNLFGKSVGAPSEFHPTDTCPHCGSRLLKTEGLCPNPDCVPKVRVRLEHWCSPAAMDIPSGDAAMIERLVTPGLVRDVSEFYRLKVKELAALPGLDKDTAQKFFDALAASKQRDAWRVLFGLAIPKIGADESKKLCQSFRSLDEIFAAGRERIQRVSGVPEPIAHSLAHWYGDPENRRMIGRLAKAGINFKSAL